jgi:arylsulfatase A-like enzyme
MYKQKQVDPMGPINALNRRQFLKFAACSSLLAVPKLSFPKTKHPNVLLLFADQHRASAVGCYGDPNVKTPNLDRLADDGVRMDAAYSNTPVCCPFRACLMTGLYSFNHGMMTNYSNFLPKGPLLAQTFKNAGYSTGYIGKWHLEFPSHDKLFPGKYPGAHPRYIPPQRRLGYDWWRMDNKSHHHFSSSFFIQDATQPTKPKDGWQPTAFTNLAMDFIKSKKQKDTPWFLTVSYGPPHTPYKAPEKFTNHYNGETIKLSPNVPAGKAERFARKNLPDYYGMVESLDVEVGRLVDHLQELGLDKDTIILYTSDHGDQMGSHGYKVKRWPHDESARIPFILKYPAGVPKSQVVQNPIGATDFFPTLVGMSGVGVPNGLDGKDFSPLLKKIAKNSPRDYVFSQMTYGYVPWPGWRSLRTNKYLYAETKLGPWLLFDIKNDNHQINNLVGNSEYAETVRALSFQLKNVMQQTGDSWNLKVGAEFENEGDVKNWQPGGNKFRQINLDVDWPGKNGWKE